MFEFGEIPKSKAPQPLLILELAADHKPRLVVSLAIFDFNYGYRRKEKLLHPLSSYLLQCSIGCNCQGTYTTNCRAEYETL